MIGSIISLLGSANTIHDFFKRVCTIIKGDSTERHLKQISERCGGIKIEIERLSQHILYTPTFQSVRDIHQPRQQVVDSLREIRESLEPVQQTLGDDILSSAMIWTPEKMQNAMKRNPWEVLLDIRPVNLATRPTHADMLPVLFEFKRIQYIGWQLRGTMPMLFDCEYNDLWLPVSQTIPVKPIQKYSLLLKRFAPSFKQDGAELLAALRHVPVTQIHQTVKLPSVVLENVSESEITLWAQKFQAIHAEVKILTEDDVKRLREAIKEHLFANLKNYPLSHEERSRVPLYCPSCRQLMAVSAIDIQNDAQGQRRIYIQCQYCNTAIKI